MEENGVWPLPAAPNSAPVLKALASMKEPGGSSCAASGAPRYTGTCEGGENFSLWACYCLRNVCRTCPLIRDLRAFSVR